MAFRQLAIAFAAPALCVGQTVTVPAGTQLPVATPKHLRMRVGEPIRAELIYPVYAGSQLVLPAHTIVNGTVIALAPNHKARVRARINGDFTPFRTPTVQFESIELASGVRVPISTGPVTDGAPMYRLVAPPPPKGGFFARGLAQLKVGIKERLSPITDPDKSARFVQFLYHQLPYHPQQIAKGTDWTAETSAPIALEAFAEVKQVAPIPSSTDGPPTWIVQAYLTTPISSETSHAGDAISATVAEPILNADGTIAVPEGSLLTGEVNQARPARRFTRAGELSFSFKKLQLPGQDAQSVRASLKGADSSSDAALAMNSEGQVKPKPQDKLLVPFLLLQLAGRPLDRDHGEHMFGKDAVASNSLGLVGFIIGTAAQKPNVAAGIGFYGAATSIYFRIFDKGKPVAFARDTRVVIQTTPTRSAALKAGKD